ncbi:MAG: thioredoxin domain-containing protein [Chitinivibrionales bacterium]|nr:thioredoxin domain-containing protein [Chitinivibrionales bacterium]
MRTRIIVHLMLFVVQSVCIFQPQGGGLPYYDSLLNETKKSLRNQSMKILLDSVTRTFTLDGCCRMTLQGCFEQKPDCSIGQRFTNHAAWLVLYKLPYDTIMRLMQDRYNSLVTNDTVKIAESFLATAGSPQAPFTITAYMSVSCPRCKRVCIPLYHAVTQGRLRGIAKLRMKPFSSGADDLVLLAAQKCNGWWPLYLSLEQETGRLDQQRLITKAHTARLDTTSLKKFLSQDTLRLIQKEYKREGVKNGVSVTPTFFINNRRYVSSIHPDWIIDAIECSHELSQNSKK